MSLLIIFPCCLCCSSRLGLRKSLVLATRLPGTFCWPGVFSQKMTEISGKMTENDGNFRENDGKWQEMTGISAWMRMTKMTEISVFSQAQFNRCPAINFYLCSSSGDELCAMPVLLRWPSSNLIAEEKFLVQGERSPRIIKRQVLVLQ